MTQDNQVDGWFDDAGRSGAPSAAFKTVGDSVVGEVVDQFTIDYVPFGKTEPARDDRTGETIKQLVIVIQTELRNWDGVSKVPTDGEGKPKDPSLDDGKRAIYVRKFTNIHGAIGTMLKDASAAAGRQVKVENGGRLGVQFYKTEDTGKGNPLKHFRGKYTPPAPSAASDDFFDQPSQVGGGSSAPAASPAPSAPAAQDPWSSPAAQDEPPF